MQLLECLVLRILRYKNFAPLGSNCPALTTFDIVRNVIMSLMCELILIRCYFWIAAPVIEQKPAKPAVRFVIYVRVYISHVSHKYLLHGVH